MSRSNKRQLRKPPAPPPQQPSTANTVAWISLSCITLAVISSYLIFVFSFGAPSFQATIVLLFNAGILMAAFAHLRSGSIYQRILWSGYYTVYRDTSPRWFWISWWCWLVLPIAFSETALISYCIEIVRRGGVVE